MPNSFTLLIVELVVLFITSHFITINYSRLLYSIARREGFVTALVALTFYPGVLIHELAHFLAAKILFVHVSDMEFVPVNHGDGLKLGSVSIAKCDPIRRMFIGVAPILVGIALISIIIIYFQSNHMLSAITHKLLLGFILFEISNTMFSSRKDVEGLFAFSLVILFICFFLYIFGVNILTVSGNILTSQPFIHYLSVLQNLFIIPVIINLGVLLGITCVLYLTRS